ncbi:MAG: hypothetical protein AVDCRST_MAG67-3414 [uncultured Solirubrobacteraceae bacterium]|uniref:PsbP C-terminal domain-containing protein n=1 Tax=uncultured Solirubrobacteraceae bacterium TaxID=1162706 RepID=A0A6J4TGV6_9ACTN|nr:MAG: hypothetical protein AVDCRST_MAG67-3414 [uncultured Solirubrobacteraceae bacterium]
MNRKWLVGGVAAFLALAAVLALVVGGVVGRSIVPSATEPETPAVEPDKTPSTLRFTDTLTDVSIAYPSTWQRRFPSDQAVRLVASSPDASAAVSISVRKSGLETITMQTLPIVRPLTDDLLREDPRIATVPEPVAVTADGLPGYRYTYTYRRAEGGAGAHIHYFLFKGDRLIQMVLQAVPASKLASLQPTFDEVARTFRKGPA